MAIDSDLHKVLSIIGLQDAPKEAITKGLPTIEDLEDLFSEMADNRAKVESTLHLVVDMDIVSDTDIHRTMFVFDWFIDNIVDPNFAWASFTRGAYISDKCSHAITKAANTTAAATRTSTAPVTSTIDFFTNMLTADANQQTRPVTPRMTATLKPHFFGSSRLHRPLVTVPTSVSSTTLTSSWPLRRPWMSWNFTTS
jgi:hypothetical protein